MRHVGGYFSEHTMTTIRVEKLVDTPKQTLINYVKKVSNFESWWSNFNTRYEKRNQTITFSPIPLWEFQLKLIKITENEIQFDYLQSPFNGVGIWLFNEQSNYQTLVSYTISITGKNFLVDIFINSVIFRWKHKRDILKLIDKLNQI